MNPQAEKSGLRNEIRIILESIADQIEEKSRFICGHLFDWDIFRHALQTGRLMSFVSMPLEVQLPLPFSEKPAIIPYCEAGNIIPIRIFSKAELVSSGRLNLLEPKSFLRFDLSRRVSPEEIELILVPGLAFDRFGNRLGRGKGYYDRFLSGLPTCVFTLGLTFDATLHTRIPCNEHDVPVRTVLTESGFAGSYGSDLPATTT